MHQCGRVSKGQDRPQNARLMDVWSIAVTSDSRVRRIRHGLCQRP